MNNPRIAAAAVLLSVGVGVVVLLPQAAGAHHNTIVCAGPGQVSVANSEPISMTFDSNQGDDDVPIGPNGSVIIGYDGGDLIVDGTWANGVTNSVTFNEDCGGTETTEPPVETTVVETTEPTDTTVVETTEPTETTEPPVETTEPPTETTEPPVDTTTTEPPVETTEPPTPTTEPPVPPTTIITPPDECEIDHSDDDLNGNGVNDDCEPVCTPVLTDYNGDGDYLDKHENSCFSGPLPATQ